MINAIRGWWQDINPPNIPLPEVNPDTVKDAGEKSMDGFEWLLVTFPAVIAAIIVFFLLRMVWNNKLGRIILAVVAGIVIARAFMK